MASLLPLWRQLFNRGRLAAPLVLNIHHLHIFQGTKLDQKPDPKKTIWKFKDV